MNASAEEWRPIPGFSGYEVSDLGRVRSWRRYRPSTPPPRVLAPVRGTHGYATVWVGGERRLLHRLVLLAFVGPCPGGMETRHLNGDRTNNALANLAYGTHRENVGDQIRHGTTTGHNRQKTHCPKGHPYNETNTYRYKGERHCRECRAIANRMAEQKRPPRYRPHRRRHATNSSATVIP